MLPVREDRIDAPVRVQQQVAGVARGAGAAGFTQSWAFAGTIARPTPRSVARSGRSSPMNATWSMPIPISSAMPRMQASFSRVCVCTRAMPSSRPRRSTTALTRAVTSATSMPAWRSSTMPSPSCTWNDLDSSPSSAYSRRPSVSVPSTSKPITRMRAARSSTSAG